MSIPQIKKLRQVLHQAIFIVLKYLEIVDDIIYFIIFALLKTVRKKRGEAIEDIY